MLVEIGRQRQRKHKEARIMRIQKRNSPNCNDCSVTIVTEQTPVDRKAVGKILQPFLISSRMSNKPEEFREVTEDLGFNIF